MTITKSWLPLYVWWVVTVLLAVGAYWAGINGVYQIVYNADVTHLTQVIGVIVLIGIARIGWLSYKWGKITETEVSKILKHYDEWWFITDMLVIIGLIGTLIGFSMTFYVIIQALAGSSSGLTSSLILQIIPKLIVPMGTVFFPTIFGLLGLAILKVQLVLFKSFSGIEDDQYETDYQDA